MSFNFFLHNLKTLHEDWFTSFKRYNCSGTTTVNFFFAIIQGGLISYLVLDKGHSSQIHAVQITPWGGEGGVFLYSILVM